jgi:Zn-dependent protease with chaperone function
MLGKLLHIFSPAVPLMGRDRPARTVAAAAPAVRLERQAARRLRACRRRVIAAAALGDLVVIGVLVLLAGCLLIGIELAFDAGEAMALPVALLLLVLVVLALAQMRARVPEPQGVVVGRSCAPELFARLDSLADRIGGPRFDRVLLTEDFNAAIVQRPRRGLPGWPRNHLLVGLPLIQALATDQFEAVLAHEYGHVANTDGRIAAWIHRVRGSWLQAANDRDARWRWGGPPLRGFLAWYPPWFCAQASALARQTEFAADRIAAAVTSPRAMLDALVTVAVRGRQLECAFWPNLYDGARFEAEPPAAYRALGVAMKQGLAPDAADAHLAAVLARRARLDDTHPALIERAKALGQRIRIPPVPIASAAEELLGTALEPLLAQFDARWAARCGAAWRDTYRKAEEERRLLAELELAQSQGTLSLEHRWCRARLTERVQNEACAELLYRAILADTPDHAPTHFALARLMLARDDLGGLAHLENAMARDWEAVAPGCELAMLHLARLGHDGEAQVYGLRARQAQEAGEESRAERAGIALDDAILPAGLDPAALRAVRAVLAAEPTIDRAWLVRKALRHERGRAFLIVVVSPGVPAAQSGGAHGRLSKALWHLALDADFWVVPDSAANAPLCARVKAIDGCAVFTRARDGARS